MNTDLHRAIVGDGVYLKAQRVRRAVPFNLVQMEHLPTSSGQLFNGVTQRNTVNHSTEVKILFLNLAFERWPYSEKSPTYGIEKVFEKGNEAFVLYDCETKNGGGSRNTEFFTIEGNKINEVEVYFGSAPKEPA